MALKAVHNLYWRQHRFRLQLAFTSVRVASLGSCWHMHSTMGILGQILYALCFYLVI